MPEPMAPIALTDSEVLDEIRGSPVGTKLLREREEAHLAQRQGWAEEMASAQAEYERGLPRLTAAERTAREKVAKAETALKAAQESLRGALNASGAARSQFDRRRGELEQQLQATAPPEIDAFIREMGSEHEAARRVPPTVRQGGRHPITQAGLPDVSNFESINARLLGLQEARVQAEALKLRPLGREELKAALAAIRDGVPVIEWVGED